MITLNDYIIKRECDILIFNEEINIMFTNMCNEDNINESFQSSIIQNLAQRVYDVEKNRNMNEIQNNKNRKENDKKNGLSYSDSWYKPKIISFASIFGPILKNNKYDYGVKKVRGIKWSEIKNDDLTLYTSKTNNKELIKLIKNSYRKKDVNSIIIVTDKNDKPILFIKAFNEDPKSDGVFRFRETNNVFAGVKEITKELHNFSYRALKITEVVELVKNILQDENIKIYALEITPQMISDYKQLTKDREEAQKGVINYDKASLENYLKKQKARYNVLIKKMKESKLTQNMDIVWDKVKKTQDDVVEIYKRITNTPEYLDKFYKLGELMRNVSYAYESIIRYYSSMHKADITNIRYHKYAQDHNIPVKDNDEEFNYDRADAREAIVKVDEYLKEVEKEIAIITQELDNES